MTPLNLQVGLSTSASSGATGGHTGDFVVNDNKTLTLVIIGAVGLGVVAVLGWFLLRN